MVRLFWASNFWRRRLSEALDTGFYTLWLGLLSRDDLAWIDETFYRTRREPLGEGSASYVDDEWNASGLQPWEEAMIDAHFPREGRVVVTGAGGGREVLALLQRGFDAVGYEPHPKLVEAGGRALAERGFPERLFVSERDAFPAAQACDAVVVGWGSYMLMPGRQRRIAFLRAAREALEPGSPLLVSFFTRPAGSTAMERMARRASVIRRLRRLEPAEAGDFFVPNYVHYFVREEIAAELAAAGFRMAHFEEEPYGHAIGVAV